jgi:glycogen debranching enzyme
MVTWQETLRNRIKLERMPFSDRGSRLLLFKEPETDRLYIRLAERLTALQPGLSTYRARAPLIQDLRFTDSQGEPLAYHLTTYPHCLRFDTAVGQFVIAFQDEDTLSIGLPASATVGVRFAVRPEQRQTDSRGGALMSVRNVAYSTNGQMVNNEILAGQEVDLVDCRVHSETDTAITITVRPDLQLHRSVQPFSAVLSRAEERWHRWFETVPPVADQYAEQYLFAWWIMGNNLLSPRGCLRYEAMVPSKVHYIGVWQWDACFHALAYRHVDIELARNQLRVMLDHQLPNGMIPDAIYDEGIIAHLETPVAAAVTKPPVAAWAAMKLHDTCPDLDSLRETYAPLVRWNAWWFGLNDDDGDGVAQYNHPFSSGLDDSPLWDKGMPVESPELNTYLSVQMEALAKMARILGRESEAMEWEHQRHALADRLTTHFYDPRAGIFWATRDHVPIPVLTPFNLYPLWTGLLDKQVSQRLIDHLTDPGEFWTAYPIPTVARSDPQYDGQQMWRGPTWVNINYIFTEALRRCGRSDLAGELRRRTLEMIMRHDDIYEYYNPDTGAPPAAAAPGFGWSAALFIDMAIEASREA